MARYGTVSPETRAKIAASVRKSWVGADERKREQSERSKGKTNKGRCWTLEQRRHMSEKMRGNQNGLGKSASVETRTKLAASVRKSWQNADKRKAAQSERSKGNTWGGMREITPEYLAGLGEKARFHAQKDLPDCPCPMHNAEARLVRAYGIKRTGIEAKLCDVLLAEFPEVQEQVRFGDYMVDAYLPPPYHLVFEADGEYWHQHPKKDAARDKYLLRRFGLPVVRLRGKELMEMV